MIGASLRLRLAVAAAVSIVLALLLAGWLLAAIFERHVIRRIDAELDSYVRQLAADLSLAPDGEPQLARELAHPRFEQPHGGLYWQIEDEAGAFRIRSRSLWDFVIGLPRDDSRLGSQHSFRLPGPGGSPLLVHERRITYSTHERSATMRIAAALAMDEVARARHEFAGDVARALAALAIILTMASFAWITFGLRPFDDIRRSVKAVRSGASQRLDLNAPREVMPLVAEVNSLLEQQARALEAAQARAADLAHGLKTPLTILGADAERLRQRGERELAGELDDLVSSMRHHVGRELARARRLQGARLPAASADLAAAVASIVRTLSRSPAGAKLAWRTTVPEGARAAMRIEDLLELLGTLLENASKWAGGEVRIEATAERRIAIVIEDDGPGVSHDALERLGRRGVRLDQSTEGHGLGLAIAGDIVEDYGGTIAFGLRQPHGFRVTLDLPLAE